MATSTFSIGGLASGLDTNSIIDALIAVERLPITRLEAKVADQTDRLTAWQSINTKLLTLKIQAYSLSRESTFKIRTASSSNSSVLTATAQNGATTGTFTYTVQQLAQTHQISSRGFNDSDQTSIGTGTITIEKGEGKVDRSTSLKFLNGQEGVSRGSIKISDRAGNTATIDLSKALTIGDVIGEINTNSNIQVTASINDTGDGLLITDDTGSIANNLIIQEVGSGSTAADLGILANVSAKTITGDDINYIVDSTSLSNLNDGRGVYEGAIKITDRVGNVDTIDLSDAKTIQDVIDLIEAGPNTDISVQVGTGANGLTIIDNNGVPTGNLIIEEVSGGRTAESLGILTDPTGYAGSTFDGQDIISGLDTVLLTTLNGGSGVSSITGDDFQITNTLGGTFNVDISGASTLDDVINAINGAIGNTGVVASVNSAGNGIKLTDTLGGSGDVSVTALGGSTAASDLGILKTGNGAILEGSDLDPQYVSLNTLLEDFNSGAGVSGGKMKITDRAGNSAEIDLTNATTISDVLNAISLNPLIDVTATINATGDGILITDDTGSTLSNLVIEEVGGGSTASDLNILSNVASDTIDGTLETTITIDSDNNTLEGLMAAINDSGSGVSASILNDGGTINPYRLFITSDLSGMRGEMIIDTSGLTGGVSLNLSDTVEAQNSVVVIGDATSGKPIVIEDSDTTIDSVVSGVSLELHSASDSPVTITVDTDTDTIKSTIEGFVDMFNSVISTIDDYTAYDSETEVAGILFGSNDLSMIRTDLYDFVVNSVEGASAEYSLLSQIGINLGLAGQLSVDSSTLSAALEDSVEDVMKLFTLTNNVAGATFGSTATAGSTGNLVEGFTIVNDSAAGSFTYDETNHELDFVMDQDLGQQRYTHGLPDALDIDDDFELQFDINLSEMLGTGGTFGIGLTNSSNSENLASNAALAYFGLGTADNISDLLIDDTGDTESSAGFSISTDTDYRVKMSYDSATQTMTTQVFTGADYGTQVGTDQVVTFDPADSVSFDSFGLVNNNTAAGGGQVTGSIKNFLYNGSDFYSASGVIDGNTDGADFGTPDGGWVNDVENETGASLEIDFGTTRTISQVVIHTMDTDEMPAESYGLKSYQLQYYDEAEGEWITAATVSANAKGEIVHTFSNPLNTDKIRIYNPQGNDGYARILEVEAFEHAGLAGRLNDRLGYITDAYEGQILNVTDGINDLISDYEVQIENKEELILIREEQLRKMYAAMESAISQWQSMGDFLSQQVDNFSVNWSFNR